MKTTPSTAKSLLLTGAVGITTLLSACQTAPPAPPANAVTCSKCQTVWVQEPVAVAGSKPGSGHYTLKSKPVMTCTQCESAIGTFFKTGHLQHHCSIYGGTLNHCAGH